MKTALYDRHCALGAKIVDFYGWMMPLQYSGIIQEHNTVRNKCGIFDVSHMGLVEISGHDAEIFLDYLSTNIIAGKSNLTATYTVWCSDNGFCLDDVIIFKKDPKNFFVIVNASNREKDLQHMQQEARKFSVNVRDRYKDYGILSIQGPSSYPLMNALFPETEKIPPMHFIQTNAHGRKSIISHTGYTGAGGFELIAENDDIAFFWDLLLTSGSSSGIVPAGLGARNTLRLEMGYALYGHELSDTIYPTESVAAWTVKNKENYIGKNGLQLPPQRFEYGLEMQQGIARDGYSVFKNEQKIGYVTSGAHSPTLNKGIAIALVNVPLRIGEGVEVQVREHKERANVVKMPFIRKKV